MTSMSTINANSAKKKETGVSLFNPAGPEDLLWRGQRNRQQDFMQYLKLNQISY